MQKENIQRFNKFIEKLQGKEEKSSYEYMALCPHHGDARLSLWVKLEENGRIAIHCHAGCSASDVCNALGFKLRILYPTPQIVDLFDYTAIDGSLIYQEVKFDTTTLKRFQARRPNDKKKSTDPWIWSIDKVERILYNLFEISKAKPNEIIFMCEGAKDARTLLRLGLSATAAIFNDWVTTDTSPLDNKKVVILEDNDSAGKIKAITAGQDRYGKSASIKLLLLPGLKEGGDVTDWLEDEKSNTKEKLLELANDDNLKEWYPKDSIRQQVTNEELTGLVFEYFDPRPAFLNWLEIFHPPEEGPLYFYDDRWLKGDIINKIFKEILKNRLINSMTEFFKLCFDKKSKNCEGLFKPTPRIIDTILKSGESKQDLDIIENPTIPIFRPFFMPEREKNYKTEDIIILKNGNFYIPERIMFPRNMDACIALSALPFDYNPKAKCPLIDKTLDIQWGEDKQSVDLLLQYIYYCMKHTHIYKSILYMVGNSDSGKSLILELIRNFLGEDSCESLSLGKIGRAFELYRARNAQLLISDDVRLTERDLQDGALIENLLSIPAGAPIRIERKNGEIFSKVLPCQLILAGNDPPKIPQLSNALANRFKFLNFSHVFVRGEDMDPHIVFKWVKELPGLMNRVLDTGMELEKIGGFLEPSSASSIRDRFEGGSTPIRKFIKEWFSFNANGFVRIKDMKMHYKQYCEEEGLIEISATHFNEGLESISGIKKDGKNVKIENGKYVWIRGWIGIQRKENENGAEQETKEEEF